MTTEQSIARARAAAKVSRKIVREIQVGLLVIGVLVIAGGWELTKRFGDAGAYYGGTLNDAGVALLFALAALYAIEPIAAVIRRTGDLERMAEEMEDAAATEQHED